MPCVEGDITPKNLHGTLIRINKLFFNILGPTILFASKKILAIYLMI